MSEQLITGIVLFTLICGYGMDVAAGLLNLKSLKPELPEEFSDIYDPVRYARSQSYLKTNTRFEFVSNGIDLALLLIFWFCRGFGILDTWARQFGFNPILTGLIFFGCLALIKLLVSLPFSLYATFVIEEKFGFNNTTPLLFFKDLLKSICLGIFLGAPLLAVILWFLGSFGPSAWLFCWMASALFLVMVQYIVPTWIMPLFNTFTPLEQGPLKEAIFSYARSIAFPLTQIFVMDGSRRSSKSNAFFTGFGKNKRIVLFDTLVHRHEIDELVSVLAHEMGHFKKRHVLRRLALGIGQMGLVFFLVSVCISQKGLFHAFYVERMSVHAGLVFFSLLFSPVDMLVSVVLQIFSRKDEYAADRFAAQTQGKPAALISALKKLSAHNLSNLTPHPFYVFLNYSHPPVLERVRALKDYEREASV